MAKPSKVEQQYLAPEKIEEQEHLSLARLQQLVSSIPQGPKPFENKSAVIRSPRPTDNFFDLMNWVEKEFGKYLIDQVNLHKFVHNRIVIDGQFMQFCEERKIQIQCLDSDSTISWTTDHGFEKFFAQGVFKIRSKEVEFLHIAGWQKGNQYEDEISFFIICSEANYTEYLKLRNDYDDWVSERDRSNLHIRVVDGDDLPYTKDHVWEDLFLPSDIKTELKCLVENFLLSKDFYLQNKIPWKTGVLLWGKAGNGKTSIIRTLMSAYNFKPITIAAGANDESVRDAFTYAEEQSPSLLYFEDLDSLFEQSITLSSFLNLMDGVAAKNGLFVVATANDIKKLKPSITDRPSRFDRKFEIPLPDNQMAYLYLKKWFAALISVKKCRELAKFSVRHNFSYSHLKELYIATMFEALAHNRKVPTEKDMDRAFLRLVKDKNMVNNGMISMDKYLQ